MGASSSQRRDRRCRPEGGATPSDRPELSGMADDYGRYALSQRAAFEATHPAALAAARLFADERVLRVVDLGAADGVNSHGLIRDLGEQRDWRRASNPVGHGATPSSRVVLATAGARSPGFGLHVAPSRETVGSPVAWMRRLSARSQWRDHAGFAPDFP